MPVFSAITTFIDATGLVVYFLIAKAVLGHLTPGPRELLSSSRATDR